MNDQVKRGHQVDDDVQWWNTPTDRRTGTIVAGPDKVGWYLVECHDGRTDKRLHGEDLRALGGAERVT